LIASMKRENVELDRKIMSALAEKDPSVFAAVVKEVTK